MRIGGVLDLIDSILFTAPDPLLLPQMAEPSSDRARPRANESSILGSTGSIGESALKVARDIPDRMEVVGLAAHRSVGELATRPGNSASATSP